MPAAKQVRLAAGAFAIRSSQSLRCRSSTVVDGNAPTNNLLAEPIPKVQTMNELRDTAAAMEHQADLMQIVCVRILRRSQSPGA
jgi:hypothetical protein